MPEPLHFKSLDELDIFLDKMDSLMKEASSFGDVIGTEGEPWGDGGGGSGSGYYLVGNKAGKTTTVRNDKLQNILD